MTRDRYTYRLITALLLCLVQTAGIAMYGQDRPRAASKRGQRLHPDTTTVRQSLNADSLGQASVRPLPQHPAADSLAVADSIAAENRRKMLEMTANPSLQLTPTPADSLQQAIQPKTWVPNPTRATWLALVIPGGGQIYNRKYWKLPIFYGGFAGCAYALTWNGKMYKDYSNAYKDAVNGNWSSSTIQDLLPNGYVERVGQTQVTNTLKRRKDTYRRYRDLSVFAFIAVYLVSVVDAYVDAELSNFDITPDLSMRVEPAVINNQMPGGSSGYKQSVGVQCSLRF